MICETREINLTRNTNIIGTTVYIHIYWGTTNFLHIKTTIIYDSVVNVMLHWGIR